MYPVLVYGAMYAFEWSQYDRKAQVRVSLLPLGRWGNPSQEKGVRSELGR